MSVTHFQPMNVLLQRMTMLLIFFLSFGSFAQAQTSFNYAPNVISFSPTAGPPGTTVTVFGTRFTGANAATVGGSSNATVTVLSDNTLTFVVPANANTGTVRVHNPTYSGNFGPTFTVGTAAAISISSFTPTTGGIGTQVTVTGNGLLGVSSASIGNSARVAVTDVTATSLRFVVPAGAMSGAVAVHGASASAVSSANFAVQVPGVVPSWSPNVMSFSPVSGPVGTLVTVSGTGFLGATSATVGNSVGAPVTVASDTSLTFQVPANANTGTLRVHNPTYSGNFGPAFTVTTAAAAPIISGFAPLSGPVGTEVTVTGTGLTGATSASIGTSASVAVTAVTATSLRFIVPASATSGTIRITTANGSAISPAGFTITVPATVPAIASFSPVSGPVGTVITVSGSGLTGITSAAVGNSANVAVINGTAASLQFAVPADASSGALRISSASNTVFSAGSFTVTAPTLVPAITGFSPLSGPVGTVITVTGTGFTGATSAALGSATGLAISNVTATSLSFTVPTGASSGTIRISNATNSGVSAGSFTVTVPASVPVVSGFSPSSGPAGTVVTVSGTGFTGATSAAIGNSAGVSVSNVTATSLSFTVAAGSGSGVIRVSNGTNSGTSAASFTVTVPVVPPPVGAMGQTAAVRLLTQGTFGPTLSTISTTAAQSYGDWFAAQLVAPVSLTLPGVPNKDTNWVPAWWQNVVNGPDQLRQRTAFALSQIFVVSDQAGSIMNQNQTMAGYYDLLAVNAFGNYRTLLEKVTLSPTMGLYLNMFRNNKENLATGVHADQNYAREIMQLFSVGLVQLNLDGTVRRDAAGNAIPTYTQADVEGISKVFTGWASAPVNGVGESAWTYDIDYLRPMVAYPAHHDTNAKTIIGNVTIPAGGTAESDLRIALDTLFNHPNVGPFMATRLIQRMVTSNPSPQYVARVATVFNDNGLGVRGDLFAVVRAILTDVEAVNTGDNTYGKLREPILRLTHLWRAFSAADSINRVADPNVLLMSNVTFGQSVLSSPSVFNFFAPDYQRVGPLSFADLVAPEFQITNENTLILTSNMLQRLAYQYVNSAGTRFAGPNGYSEAGSLGAQSVLLKTAAWEGFATDAATLVDRLNIVFLQGLMPAAMRTTLINYVNTIPANQPATRVIEATDLLVNSPQYAVQR